MKNLVNGVFIEDAEIAIGEEVHLESLELDALLARHILDGDCAIVGKAGLGTDGSVLWKARSDDVTRVLIGPGIELWQFRLDARAGVIGSVIGHDGSYCTLLDDFEATASCRNQTLPLSSCEEDPPEFFDELPSV